MEPKIRVSDKQTAPTPPCPRCDGAGRCTYECVEGLSREERQQAQALQSTLAASLSDLGGRRVTPDLVEEITSRMMARMKIADQLVEREVEDDD
jgi:hypothetical protein